MLNHSPLGVIVIAPILCERPREVRSLPSLGICLTATLALVACSSALRYSTVHVPAKGTKASGQLYAGTDWIGLTPVVSPPSAVERKDKDPVFELDSRDGGPDASSATLWLRPSADTPRVIASLRGTRQNLADGIHTALLDAGSPQGIDITIAYVEDDNWSIDAGATFLTAVGKDSVDRSDALARAVASWWALLIYDAKESLASRRDNERAMAAAYGIALAEKLSGSHSAAFFAMIAVLRAPTDALALDILRLLENAPTGVLTPTTPQPWRDKGGGMQRELDCKDAHVSAMSDRNDLAWQLVRGIQFNQARLLASSLGAAPAQLPVVARHASHRNTVEAIAALNFACPE